MVISVSMTRQIDSIYFCMIFKPKTNAIVLVKRQSMQMSGQVILKILKTEHSDAPPYPIFTALLFESFAKLHQHLLLFFPVFVVLFCL